MSDAMVIVLILMLLGTAFGLLGTFLVVRRMALVSDAVGHAVFPGVVAGYLVAGHDRFIPMLVGAAILASACTLGVEWLRGSGRLGPDAAIALVFPALFALGVAGVSRFAANVHLDLDATVYGEITFAPIRTIAMWGAAIPRGVLAAAVAVILATLAVIWAWRPLVTVSFDEGFSTASGLRTRWAVRLLLVIVAVVAVLGFESIGAALTIMLLIVPAATAHLLARTMAGMAVLAVATSWMAALAGYLVAVRLDTTITGSVGVATVLLFLGVVVTQSVIRRSAALGAR